MKKSKPTSDLSTMAISRIISYYSFIITSRKTVSQIYFPVRMQYRFMIMEFCIVSSLVCGISITIRFEL